MDAHNNRKLPQGKRAQQAPEASTINQMLTLEAARGCLIAGILRNQCFACGRKKGAGGRCGATYFLPSRAVITTCYGCALRARDDEEYENFVERRVDNLEASGGVWIYSHRQADPDEVMQKLLALPSATRQAA